MRKATGKVVSLVLALALVVTSFSSNFAFAATETGKATIDTNVELYLANTSDDSNALDVEKYFNLNTYLDECNEVTLTTYDHAEAESVKISQVTVSGDNILKVTKITDDNDARGDKDDYIVSVRSTSGTGTATLKILFNGTVSRDGEDVTVRGSDEIEVTLLDAETPIMTTGIPTPGKGADALSDLQKNPNAEVDDPDKENAKLPASVKAAYVIRPTACGEAGLGALATYERVAVYAEDKDGYLVDKDGSEVSYDEDGDDVYVLEASGSSNKAGLEITNNTDGEFTYSVSEPAVGNYVRVTLSSAKKVTDETAKQDYYTSNKSLDKQTLKVANKISGLDVTEIAAGDGTDGVTINNESDKLLSKSKTYAKYTENGSTKYWEITNGDVDGANNKLVIESGKVGTVSDGDTEVTVNGGTVAKLDVESVDADGGSIDEIVADSNVSVAGATVGKISEVTEVTVTSGKVTGTVDATEVTLAPASDEDPVSVGDVKAEELTVNGTDAAATVASFFAKDAATVTLQGANAVIGALNFDYRPSTLTFDAFVGTIPAPTKANKTDIDDVETGLTISALEGDDEDETNATISGNLNVYSISLDGGTVTFTGKVNVAEVGGGEATMVVNAGALNITESVSTSNTLQLADPADVVLGTVVYTAASEIADEDSFIGKGFTVKLVEGTSTDAFVIDSTSFAGLSMNKTSAEIVVGTSETFTASAYPAGTSLPEGAYIKFFIDGVDDYISGVDNQNGTATLTAHKYDSTFSVLNKATLTAYVYDEYGIELEEYGKATCLITVIETPKVSYISDTTNNVNVVAGNTYQFKITSVDGTVPQFDIAGDNAIFKLVAQSQEGNDYFFKVQAVGTVGQVCGVYVNKEATPVATLTVSADYTCDTTTVNVPVGGTYQVKITANSMPTLAAGNSIYTVAFASQSGNDYFFKITATENAKAGDVVGFYINGGARAFVATTV